MKCTYTKSTAGLFFTAVSTMKVWLGSSAEVNDKGRLDACKWLGITTYCCWSQIGSNNCTVSNTNPGKVIREGGCLVLTTLLFCLASLLQLSAWALDIIRKKQKLWKTVHKKEAILGGKRKRLFASSLTSTTFLHSL